jgi:hypothetical protein
MPRKVFTAGEVLAAADVNSFLMDQTVMSFAGTAARGSAIPSPVKGMTTILEDSDLLSIYDGTNFKTSLGITGGIIQVVEGTTSTNVQTTSGTYQASGLSATITPKSASNKVLVLVTQPIAHISGTNQNTGDWRLRRGTTTISEVDFSQWAPVGFGSLNLSALTNNFMVLDSPNTTSATTYDVQMKLGAGTRVESQYVNKRSSITLLEVSA